MRRLVHCATGWPGTTDDPSGKDLGQPLPPGAGYVLTFSLLDLETFGRQVVRSGVDDMRVSVV